MNIAIFPIHFTNEYLCAFTTHLVYVLSQLTTDTLVLIIISS